MPLGPALRSSVPASPANSHIVPIGDRCGEAEHLGEAVAREIRVFPYDVLVRHAFGQARQDERRRKACSPDRGFPAQAFGIRHEVSEPWNRCVVHVFPLGRPEGVSSPWSDLALDAITVYYDPDAKVAIAPVWTDGGSAGGQRDRGGFSPIRFFYVNRIII